MSTEIIVKLVVIFVLILFVGFFTSSETAFISLSRLKLRRMVEEKRKNAKLVEKLQKNMPSLLTTVLVGTNFLNSFVSALATSLIAQLIGGGGVGFPTFAVAFFITTFGQIIPKTIAARFPEKVSQFASIPLYLLEKIFFPIIWFFKKISGFAVWCIEKIVKPGEFKFTEEDIKTIIDVGEKEGTIEKGESKMMNKIIRFNDILVSDIMKHRSFVSMVSSTADENEVVQEFLKSGFSTIAVYKETKENIIGIINYKKILSLSQNSDSGKNFALKMMDEVEFIPATMTVLELLLRFRSEQHKFAVVLNEQGATAGIVTMEDILRTVFGRMTDEKDTSSLPAEMRIKITGKNTFLVPGDMQLEDLNENLHLNLESDNMNTIGGWILEQLGYLPSSGMVLLKNKVIYTVEDVSQRRITLVKIKI